MKPSTHARVASGALALGFVATLTFAATNLNSSRSNIYRITYPTELATPAQVRALLADLDRMGPADEAKLKQWLAANFKRFGIAGEKLYKVIVLPPARERKDIAIILLTRPEDEAPAMALTVKSTKSNTSD